MQRILKEQGVDAVLADARQREALGAEGARLEGCVRCAKPRRGRRRISRGLLSDEETQDFSAEERRWMRSLRKTIETTRRTSSLNRP